jgi:glycosyltransferase involved in cell wall biosynthesis
MYIHIILYNNPFVENSASSNRILSLIDGLKLYGVEISLLFVGGYMSTIEKIEWEEKGRKFEINYCYLNLLELTNIWKARFYKYLFKHLYESLILFKLKEILLNKSGIVWVIKDKSYLELVLKLRKKNKKLILFTEISEFPDFYLSQNIPDRHKAELKSNSDYLEKNLKKFGGLALMTNSILEYYKSKVDQKIVKICHLPMTVDLNRFQEESAQPEEFKGPYILFVGVMSDNKDGVNILIESFSKIQTRYPDYNLYLVGPWQPDSIGHQELIKKLGLEAKVKWMKEYPRNSIPSIIKNSNLLVLPRPDSRQAQGGFPTKLGEYLASGIPVCATTVGEIPDYLVDNESVFFAKPGSVESFSEAMDKALSNYENAKRVGLNGKKVAELEFNKDIQAKKLYDFLKELDEEEQY